MHPRTAGKYLLGLRLEKPLPDTPRRAARGDPSGGAAVNDATRHAKQAAAEARSPGGQARGCPRDPDDAAMTAAPRAFCER